MHFIRRTLRLPRLQPSHRSFSTRTRHGPILERLSLAHHSTPATPLPGIYDGTWRSGTGGIIASFDPATGTSLGTVATASAEEASAVLDRCREAHEHWRMVPAPKRGEVLRQIGDVFRKNREDLGALVTLEMGKIKPEGVGEVQEAVDICDYAVGLSRMVGGKVVPSERPGHFLKETSQPLGVVGVISAFNFPAAVHSWNLALSFITGNSTIWKPAPSTSLTALAITRLIASVIEANNLPGALAALICGGTPPASALVCDPRVDLLSFTGSEFVGQEVGPIVQARFGKVLLELGGNNCCVVMPSASLDLALRTVVFGAVGTAGQRCTTTRRLLLHRSVASEFLAKLEHAYAQLAPKTGHGLDQGTLIGPLHNAAAVEKFEAAIAESVAAGGRIVVGGKRKVMLGDLEGGNWVEPTIVDWGDKLRTKETTPNVVTRETFVPIMHVGTFDTLEEAVAINNSVNQALTSSLFTRDVGDVFHWTGPSGSRCGIVNVNAGTSGAEIGTSFGGNYHTGWGRESGGDAWKQYCRWSSSTINFSDDMPLAQGIQFE